MNQRLPRHFSKPAFKKAIRWVVIPAYISLGQFILMSVIAIVFLEYSQSVKWLFSSFGNFSDFVPNLWRHKEFLLQQNRHEEFPQFFAIYFSFLILHLMFLLALFVVLRKALKSVPTQNWWRPKKGRLPFLLLILLCAFVATILVFGPTHLTNPGIFGSRRYQVDYPVAYFRDALLMSISNYFLYFLIYVRCLKMAPR